MWEQTANKLRIRYVVVSRDMQPLVPYTLGQPFTCARLSSNGLPEVQPSVGYISQVRANQVYFTVSCEG